MSVLKHNVLELMEVAERLSARHVKLPTELSGAGRGVEVAPIKERVSGALLLSELHDASDLLDDPRLLAARILRVDDVLHRDPVLS